MIERLLMTLYFIKRWRVVSTCLLSFCFIVNSSHSATVSLLPAPSPVNLCALLAQKLKDPFLELDSLRCNTAFNELKSQNDPQLEAIQNEMCSAIASVRNNPFARTDSVTCKKEQRKLLISSTNPNHVFQERVQHLVEQIAPSSKALSMPSWCGYLAKIHAKDNFLQDINACQAFAAERYRTSPVASLNEYRTYCEQLASAHFPYLEKQESLRLCPAVSNEIVRLQYIEKKTLEGEQQERLRLFFWISVYLLMANAVRISIYYFYIRPKQRKKAKEEERNTQILERSQHEILTFGEDAEVREQRLIRLFEQQEYTFEYIETDYQDAGLQLRFTISRSLATLLPRDQAALGIAYLLFNRDLIHYKAFDRIRFGIIYDQGNTPLQNYYYRATNPSTHITDSATALKLYVTHTNVSLEIASDLAFALLKECSEKAPDNPIVNYLHTLSSAFDSQPS